MAGGGSYADTREAAVRTKLRESLINCCGASRPRSASWYTRHRLTNLALFCVDLADETRGFDRGCRDETQDWSLALVVGGYTYKRGLINLAHPYLYLGFVVARDWSGQLISRGAEQQGRNHLHRRRDLHSVRTESTSSILFIPGVKR